MELHHIKAFIADGEKAINEENHSITFSIPEIVDRDDEIVTAQAIFDAINDKKTFGSNSICLPCHEHRLPTGYPPCVGHWDIESAKKLANAVTMDLLFAHDTALGSEYWKVYSKRHMRAVSIGFRTKDFEMEERNRVQIRIIKKIELYEISCVAVGCNPGALSKLKAQFGDNTDNKEIDAYIEKIVASKIEKEISSLRAELEDLKLLITPDDGFAETLLLDSNSDLSDSAGKKKDEQALDKLLNCLENFKEH